MNDEATAIDFGCDDELEIASPHERVGCVSEERMSLCFAKLGEEAVPMDSCIFPKF
jgi:hypothetical protein